jgi:hypothetical protein
LSGLSTSAPPYANLVLLLELLMGVGLLAGALLARLKRFTQHAWCQSVIVLVNLLLIVFTMLPSFRSHVAPRIPLRLGKAYYAVATAHAALGTLAEGGGLYILLAELQGVDANCASAVVGGPFAGRGNLRPLVRSAYVPKIIDKHPWRHRSLPIVSPYYDPGVK